MGDPLDLRHLGQAQDPTEMMSRCTSRPRTDMAVGGSNPSQRALLLGSGRAACAAGFRDAQSGWSVRRSGTATSRRARQITVL
jgi:hypothetical protein